MPYLSAEELGRYLTTKSPIFQTSKGLSIYVNGNAISTQYKFEVEHDEDFSFCMFTEQDSHMEFIEGFRIKNMGDLEKLGYNNVWIRYLNRQAEMEVTKMENEEIPISFRLYKMKTLVFCAAAHYYDEVYEHLTLPEDFIGYFQKSKKKLLVAMNNRFKY
jgi:hypothetical protein